MDAATVVMIIFTIILFIAVIALSFMNFAQSISKVNAKVSGAPILNRVFEESGNKTVKMVASISVSALAIVSLIVLTITGATAKKDAFTYLLQ